MLFALLITVHTAAAPGFGIPAPLATTTTTAATPAPDPTFEPWGMWPTLGLRIGAGAACVAVGMGATLLGPGLVWCCVPVAVAAVPIVELSVGNRLGGKRGQGAGALVPIVVALASGLPTVAVMTLLFARGEVETLAQVQFPPQLVPALEEIGWPVAVAGLVVTVIAPAIAYQWLADDKLPDDDGTAGLVVFK